MASGGIGRASALLASGTMVSRVLGFVKAIVLTNTLGIVGSVSADAFTNAQQLPSSIYSIIAGGMLNAVLVPQVVRAARQEDGGQSYINRLVTLAIAVLGGLTLLATLAVPLVTMVYGASLDAEARSLIVALGYWCMPQVFFYGLYAVLGEVLNARGMFGPFTWAPVLNNVVSIGGLFAFSMLFGADPDGNRLVSDWSPDMVAVLGGSATLGVALQAVILFFFWRRVGLRFRPDFHWRGTGLGQAGKLATWTFGMLLITQGAGTVETIVLNIAFGRASVAAFSNAFLIFALPHAVIAVSIATAFFTRMSEAISEHRRDDYVKDFSNGARLIGLFVVFAGIAIAVVSPAVARVFVSTQDGVDLLAIILCAFLSGLVPFCGLFLVQRAFYALEDTRTQFWLFLATVPLHIFLMALASTLPIDKIAIALALAQSIMAAIRLAILFSLLRKRVGGMDGARIVRAYLVFGIAAVIAAVPGVAVMWFLGAYSPDGFVRGGILQGVLGAAIGGVVMVIVYVIALFVMRSPDLLEAAAPILRRVRGGASATADEDEGVYGDHDEPPVMMAPVEVDWGAGPATELLDVAELPARPEPPTDPVRQPTQPTQAELELAERRRRAQDEREERAYAGAWAMQGATGDLTTAGIILPMHATPTSGPRTRRERRAMEAKASAALQSKRLASERARQAAAEHEARNAGPNGARPWPGAGSGDGPTAPRDPVSRPPSQPPTNGPTNAAPSWPGADQRPQAPRPTAPPRDPRSGAPRPPAPQRGPARPEGPADRARPSAPPTGGRPVDDDRSGQDLLSDWFGDED